MKKILSVCICLLIALTGCNEITNQIDELYQQVEELRADQAGLKAQLDQINSSVSNLSTIITALQSGVYAKSVMPVDNGYSILLSNGETVTILNGKDGSDGYTPVIGVKFEDDVYYWTLDGEYLLDASGSRVRADGAVPAFDIREGYWFVSFDGGENWQQLSKAVGEDGVDGLPGDQLFSDVQYSPDSNVVVFVLQDGTTINMPCYQAISISFLVPDNCTSISAGETIKVGYTLSYGDDNTVVTAFADGNFAVAVEKIDNVSGSIIITCRGQYVDGHVNVMAFDGIGYASIGVITFYEKEMTFGSDLVHNFTADGGALEIPLSYNFEYFVEVDSASSSWLTLTSTKAETLSGAITAMVSENDGEARTGHLNIYAANTAGDPFAVITVNQEAAGFNVDIDSYAFTSDGGSCTATIETPRGVSFDLAGGTGWLSAELATIEEGSKYGVTITAQPNASNTTRFAKINLMPSDGSAVLGTVDIIQFGDGEDEARAMILDVRATSANSYIVYLPIRNDEPGNSFVIDWGDGKYDSVDPSAYGEENGRTWHIYEESNTSYVVKVSGKVVSLDGSMIPEGFRSGVVGVKQWGYLGLVSMANAFANFNGLEYLAADTSMAFAEVQSFENAFSCCPRLLTVPMDLFKFASKATDFDGVFSSCQSLASIPDRLFSNCGSALSFSASFQNCSVLSSIPDNIFNGCVCAESFDNAFRNCRSIKTIPANLFAGCPDADDFSYTFSNCSSLGRIPASLFDNQRKVRSFDHTFYSCTSVSGESPYTSIGGRSVHLYERADYPDYFTTPVSNESCFGNCVRISDWSRMPSSWKSND